MGIHGKHTRILMGAYDVSSALKEASTQSGFDKAEHSGFGDGSKKYVMGQGDGSASFSGSHQGTHAIGSLEKILSDALGDDTGVIVTIGRDRLLIGTPAELLLGKETSWEISGSKDDVVQASAEMAADGGVDYGIILHPKTAETVTGQAAGQDNAASTPNGCVAHLHIHAFSGTGGASITVKVQHSDDNAVWTDVVTFTAATAVGAQRLAVTGTVKRYTRAQWTIAGTTPSMTFTVAMARLRG